jgi:hypothetical protein
MVRDFQFDKGLLDIGRGAHVFLSGSEAFGLSNAGLVADKGESLVIDTLYDVKHALEMVDAIAGVTSTAPVRYVFKTHTATVTTFSATSCSPKMLRLSRPTPLAR